MPDNIQSDKVNQALSKFDQKMAQLRQERLDWLKKVVTRIETQKIAEVKDELTKN
jgi:DNA-directed RNA polymerase subunit F